MSTHGYSSVIRDIRSGKIAPAYLLAGGDSFLEDFFIGELSGRFLSAGERILRFSLDDDRPESFLAELGAYSLFGSRQILVVRQITRLAGKSSEELFSYLASPDMASCLIMVMVDFQPRKALFQKLSRLTTLVDARPPFPPKLGEWATYFARAKGYSLHPAALEILLATSGDSVGHVVSEMEKLFILVDEGGTITSELVEKYVGMNKAYQLWHLQQAVGYRELSKALEITISLLEYGTQATQIIACLAAIYLQFLFEVSDTADAKVFTGLNKVITPQTSRMAELYTKDELIANIERLRNADVILKSQSTPPADVLLPLLIQACKRNS